MYLIPLLALIIGVLIGIRTAIPISGDSGNYIGIAVIAGLDSLFGGWRAVFEKKFQANIFITGFFSNILIAGFLAWLGDHLGVNLFLAAALVMGWRIFTNLSMMRRYAVDSWQEYISKKKSS